ncbi:MAG: hypothetical protein EOO65_05405, partial [Methanosarcinales archaeon]
MVSHLAAMSARLVTLSAELAEQERLHSAATLSPVKPVAAFSTSTPSQLLQPPTIGQGSQRVQPDQPAFEPGVDDDDSTDEEREDANETGVIINPSLTLPASPSSRDAVVAAVASNGTLVMVMSPSGPVPMWMTPAGTLVPPANVVSPWMASSTNVATGMLSPLSNYAAASSMFPSSPTASAPMMAPVGSPRVAFDQSSAPVMSALPQSHMATQDLSMSMLAPASSPSRTVGSTEAPPAGHLGSFVFVRNPRHNVAKPSCDNPKFWLGRVAEVMRGGRVRLHWHRETSLGSANFVATNNYFTEHTHATHAVSSAVYLPTIRAWRVFPTVDELETLLAAEEMERGGRTTETSTSLNQMRGPGEHFSIGTFVYLRNTRFEGSETPDLPRYWVARVTGQSSTSSAAVGGGA